MAKINAQPHPIIERYLTALEAKLRATPGVVPEEGMDDALEFLQSEWESLARRGALISDEELFRHFVRKFGPPDDVASSYAVASGATPGLANDGAATQEPAEAARGELFGRSAPRMTMVAVLAVSAAAATLGGASIWTAGIATPERLLLIIVIGFCIEFFFVVV
jgi:hypothetical protein